jgi:hypothetical protein
VKLRNCEHIGSRSPLRDSFEADLVPSFSHGPSLRTDWRKVAGRQLTCPHQDAV